LLYKLIDMKRIFCLLCIVAFSATSNAQLNGMKLKKPKIKKENVLKKPDIKKSGKKEDVLKKSDVKSGEKKEGGALLNDKPKYNSENPDDPIYKFYSDAKANLKWARGKLDGPYTSFEDVAEDLEKARKYLDQLQQYPKESKKNYLKDMEAQYSDMQVLVDENNADGENYDGFIDGLTEWNNCFKAYKHAKDCDSKTLTVHGYYALRNDFEADYPKRYKSYYNGKNEVLNLDRYFEETYEKIELISDHIDDIESHMNLKFDASMSTDIDPGKNYLFQPERYLKELSIEQKLYTYYKDSIWYESRPEILVLQERITKQKIFLEEIISSGRGEKHKAAFWKTVVDNVRMSKVGMHDSGIEAFVKTKFKSENLGTVLKVKIISSHWKVSKNSFDLPVSKYLNCEVVYKKADGTCQLVRLAQLTRDYLGGGRYETTKVLTVFPSTDTINCNNINK